MSKWVDIKPNADNTGGQLDATFADASRRSGLSERMSIVISGYERHASGVPTERSAREIIAPILGDIQDLVKHKGGALAFYFYQTDVCIIVTYFPSESAIADLSQIIQNAAVRARSTQEENVAFVSGHTSDPDWTLFDRFYTS